MNISSLRKRPQRHRSPNSSYRFRTVKSSSSSLNPSPTRLQNGQSNQNHIYTCHLTSSLFMHTGPDRAIAPIERWDFLIRGYSQRCIKNRSLLFSLKRTNEKIALKDKLPDRHYRVFNSFNKGSL